MAPCLLTLAALRADDGPQLLGITLKYPPVQLTAAPAAQLLVTGARADVAYAHAARFEEHHGRLLGADLEIELAIPSQMGLASATITGLCAARGLARLHGLPDSPADLALAAGVAPDDGLAVRAFETGGLLAVGPAGQALRRAALPGGDAERDWVFVLVLPRVPPGTPEDLEDRRRRALWRAAAALDPAESQGAAAALWQALAADEIADFAAALMRLQAQTDAALAQIGELPPLSDAERAALTAMEQQGALAHGRAATGLGLYGLVRGEAATHRLRNALGRQIGHSGGTVMATIGG